MDESQFNKLVDELYDKLKLDMEEMRKAGIPEKEIGSIIGASLHRGLEGIKERIEASRFPKFMKSLFIFLLISSIITLILVGVVNNAFPQGQIYESGTPDWWQGPSPLSNPTWVQFFQNNDSALIFGCIFFSLFSAYMIWRYSKH
jgi:hypothetical protein